MEIKCAMAGQNTAKSKALSKFRHSSENRSVYFFPFVTQLLALQSKVRRLRSVCEKTSKREWKENKGQLNKKVLLKLTVSFIVFNSFI